MVQYNITFPRCSRRGLALNRQLHLLTSMRSSLRHLGLTSTLVHFTPSCIGVAAVHRIPVEGYGKCIACDQCRPRTAIVRGTEHCTGQRNVSVRRTRGLFPATIDGDHCPCVRLRDVAGRRHFDLFVGGGRTIRRPYGKFSTCKFDARASIPSFWPGGFPLLTNLMGRKF